MTYEKIEAKGYGIITINCDEKEFDSKNVLREILKSLENTEFNEVCIIPEGKNFENYIKTKQFISELDSDIHNKKDNESIINKKNIEKFIKKREEFKGFHTDVYSYGSPLKRIEYGKISNKNIKNSEIRDSYFKESFTGTSKSDTYKLKIEEKERYAYGVNQVGSIKSYYFTIKADECIRLYKEFYGTLFKSNIRDGLAKEGKNFKGLKNDFEDTIKYSPENFYLKNNGVTLVVEDGIIINQELENLEIDIKNPRVINGAQTISYLTEIYYEIGKRNLFEKVNIPFRIITNLKNNVNEITKALNSQNPVGPLDQFMKSEKIEILNNKKITNNIIEDRDYLEEFIKIYLAGVLFNPGKALNSSEQNKVDYVKGYEDAKSLIEFIWQESFYSEENGTNIEKITSDWYKEIYGTFKDYKKTTFECDFQEIINKKNYEEGSEEYKRVNAFKSSGYHLFISLYSLRISQNLQNLSKGLLKENIKIKTLEKKEDITTKEFVKEIIKFLEVVPDDKEFYSDYKFYKRKAKTFVKEGTLSKNSQIYQFLIGQEK